MYPSVLLGGNWGYNLANEAVWQQFVTTQPTFGYRLVYHNLGELPRELQAYI